MNNIFPIYASRYILIFNILSKVELDVSLLKVVVVDFDLAAYVAAIRVDFP